MHALERAFIFADWQPLSEKSLVANVLQSKGNLANYMSFSR